MLVASLLVLALLSMGKAELTICANRLQNASLQHFVVPAAVGKIEAAVGGCLTIDAATVGKSGARACDPRGKGCITVGSCVGAPEWKIVPAHDGVINLMLADSSACLDLFGNKFLQAYPCVHSPNQEFAIDASNGTIHAGWENGMVTIAGSPSCIAPGPPPPPPADPFCATFHPIHDRNVYDPSGPLLDEEGVWHTWEDDGAWSHWISRDLIHWKGSFTQNTTGFGGDTGSVSPTPSGVYAFWPIMSGVGRGSIGSAKATNIELTAWEHRGPTIPMPARINTGYRDPVRAFKYPPNEGRWYVGVGCGSREEGAQFCLFEADDDSLAKFTDRGSLFTTNITFGEVDGNIVWQPNNVSANMMECPDLFPLGDKWVLIGSLYKTNQWWVGELSPAGPSGAPRFTPERVGILDYGNGYAAKTGSTWVQTGNSRRVLFGFTGWQEPTMPSNCGRALIIPRDLQVIGNELKIVPIPETINLRKPQSRRYGDISSAPIVNGSRVELRLNCTTHGNQTLNNVVQGKVGVRTLATIDGTAYTEIGYDFEARAFFADHSKCCKNANSIVQRAPLPSALIGDVLSLIVFVDGGLIEAFLGGRVITPLVAPDATAGDPADRITTVTNTAGLACSIESWELGL